jgi:multidrug efflux pump subunit AcrB
MKAVIRWAIHNSPAMNTLMVAVLVVGIASLMSMRREVFPEFGLDVILVTVPYPGASPAEIEEGICQKLEEAVRSIDSIKKQTAVAQEGSGHLILELEPHVNVQRVLSEVRSEIDRIPSFPELAEDPEVKQITLRQVAIRIGVLGPNVTSHDAELALRGVAEDVRRDLLLMPAISQANLLGVRDFQIDIEIAESTLRQYGLSLERVAEIVRRENIELPGGKMRTGAQEVLLRGKNKGLTGDEIAKIPLITQDNGVVLTVGELGVVKDGFTDEAAISLIDGRPGLMISIDRTANEDLLAICDQVHDYAENADLPAGYKLVTWQDTAIDVRGRMELLRRNGIQGLILVFIVLAVFLDLRLSFWVALGIPVAVLGSCTVLLATGQTLNMISLFAFLLALGIVVDDAIVIGENIYSHRQRGDDLLKSAVQGAYEVLPSVTASVSTTIIAFIPLLYVSGVMGKFIAVMPVAVIAMLVISLLESTFILPCHLAHTQENFFRVMSVLLYPLRPIGWLLHAINARMERWLETVIRRVYQPLLRWTMRHAIIVVAMAFSLFIVTIGFIPAGITPWNIFPKLDSNWIQAKVTFPDGTPTSVTDAATVALEEAFSRVNTQQEASLYQLMHRSVGEVLGPGALGPDSRTSGSHVGVVFIELKDVSERSLKSEQILSQWRLETGEISGIDSLTFGTPEFGPGGAAIEFKLLAPADKMVQLEAAIEDCKTELRRSAKYPGVVDIVDDSRPGKSEYQFTIKETARAMGISAMDLAETVRASFYGSEVMRLQRGRHEVKLMVRYPESDRKSLAALEEIRIRGDNGIERPITEFADITVDRGYSEINRVNQLRSITITADIVEGQGNAFDTVEKLKQAFMPVPGSNGAAGKNSPAVGLLAKYPDVRIRWEGQQEQSNESMASLGVGFTIATFAMFTLLTLVFRSYVQPLIILCAIPFGLSGAILGHAIMGLPLTMFSLFGLVALTGVVVNDSIVLIDFINKRLAAGDDLQSAVIAGGSRRFRPVVLTSLTTIAGLTPILLERSFQAQVLIPMANSLCFGLALATVLVLVLVPAFFWLYGRLVLGYPANFDAPMATSHSDPVVGDDKLTTQTDTEMDPEIAVR